jgi:hypothetical protein
MTSNRHSPNPGGQVPRAWKARHVDADLGDDGLRRIAVNARDALQVSHVVAIRLDRLGDPPVEAGDGAVQILDVTEQLVQQDGVVRGEAPLEGRCQPGPLGT